MTSFAPFPSRTITLYTARLFIVRTLAVLAGLVLVLQTLDLLGEAGDILAYHGNGQAQLWQYVGLRMPQIIWRFLPFSVLLGTIITLATLNQNSEVIIFKAAGISAHQILAPLMIVGLGIAVISFVFNERLVVRSNRALDAWQTAEYGPIKPGKPGLSDVWVRDGDDLIHAGTIDGRGQKTKLGDVTVYDRTDSRLIAIIHADHAQPRGGGWHVSGVQKFDVASGKKIAMPDFNAARGISPDRFTLANVDPNFQSFTDLADSIDELEAAGRPTGPLRAGYWHKLSGPLSAFLMPLLGAVAAFGLARSGRLFIRTVMGMGLGFAYFVADNFALAMGNFGAIPPLLAAWAPFLLFLLIGEAVLFRTEE